MTDAIAEIARLGDGTPLVVGVWYQAVTKVMPWRAWQLILQRSDQGFIRKS